MQVKQQLISDLAVMLQAASKDANSADKQLLVQLLEDKGCLPTLHSTYANWFNMVNDMADALHTNYLDGDFNITDMESEIDEHYYLGDTGTLSGNRADYFVLHWLLSMYTELLQLMSKIA